MDTQYIMRNTYYYVVDQSKKLYGPLFIFITS